MRSLFDRFTRGHTLYGISKTLEAEGVPTRNGNRWHPSSIRLILTNPKYPGRQSDKGEVINLAEGHQLGWEPLIDSATFDRMQAKLADPRRKTHREGTGRKHLESGI